MVTYLGLASLGPITLVGSRPHGSLANLFARGLSKGCSNQNWLPTNVEMWARNHLQLDLKPFLTS